MALASGPLTSKIVILAAQGNDKQPAVSIGVGLAFSIGGKIWKNQNIFVAAVSKKNGMSHK